MKWRAPGWRPWGGSPACHREIVSLIKSFWIALGCVGLGAFAAIAIIWLLDYLGLAPKTSYELVREVRSPSGLHSIGFDRPLGPFGHSAFWNGNGRNILLRTSTFPRDGWMLIHPWCEMSSSHVSWSVEDGVEVADIDFIVPQDVGQYQIVVDWETVRIRMHASVR